MSHQAAYESFDGPLARMRRTTRERLSAKRPCRRCGVLRKASELAEVVAPTPNGLTDTMRIEACGPCRQAIKEMDR